MTPRQVATFRLDDELIDGLQVIADRDGVQVSEQVRQALEEWLMKHGVPVQRGGTLKENRARAEERWGSFVDDLRAGPAAKVPIPAGLSPLVAAGKLFGDLDDDEYKELAKFGAHLEVDLSDLRAARKTVKAGRKQQ